MQYRKASSVLYQQRVITTPYSLRFIRTKHCRNKSSYNPVRIRRGTSSASQIMRNLKKASMDTAILLELNFTEDDYFLTFTLDDDHVNQSYASMKHLRRNLINTLKRRYHSCGSEFKFVTVIEGGGSWTSSHKRPHIHMIVNNGISENDFLSKKLWKYGHVNIRPLRTSKIEIWERWKGYFINENHIKNPHLGFDVLAAYINKQKHYIDSNGNTYRVQISHSRNLSLPSDAITEDAEHDDNQFYTVPRESGYKIYSEDPFNERTSNILGTEHIQFRLLKSSYINKDVNSQVIQILRYPSNPIPKTQSAGLYLPQQYASPGI